MSDKIKVVNADIPACTCTTLEKIQQEVQQLRQVLSEALEIAKNTPELNLSNYDHDEVCELNSQMCTLYELLAKHGRAGG